MGKRWTIPIVELFSSRQEGIQFGSMQIALNGVTPKNLSRSLKELAEAEIIERRERREEGTLHTEYNLSKKGILLQQLIKNAKNVGLCLYEIDSACTKRKCIDCPLFGAG